MRRVDPIQTNFTSGESSPWLLGRNDIDRYYNGGEKVENFMIKNQGGIVYRPGSRNIGNAAAQGSTDDVALIEFVFSRTDAICIEMSAGKFRFLRSGAFIESAGSPVAVTVVYGTATAVPYTSAQIFEIQFTQSADVIYLAHPSHPPATLSRYSDTDWRYEIISFDYGPFQDQEPGEQDYSLNVSTPVDRMTLTSATTDDFLPATYVTDAFVQYSASGQKFLGKVKSNISDESLTIEPLEDFCFQMAPEVYSPGIYTSWDTVNNKPTFSQTFTGTGVNVAFSATGVAVREMIGGYLRFCTKAGAQHWMYVTGIGDIPEQVAYGVLVTGNIITSSVLIPSGIITRSNRSVKAVLRSSASNFFDATRDQAGRKFRVVLNGKVVYCTGRVADPSAPYSEPTNSGSSLAVNLDRALPRSIEGLAVIDEGTTNEWNRGSWYTGNYPTAVGFHEERLCFAGTTDEPQTGWMSKTADFYNFATTDNELRVLDTSAITFTVASNTVNQILWLMSHGDFFVGTAGGTYTVVPSSSGKPLTATNISVKVQSSYGEAYARALQVGKSILSIQRGARKVRQLAYAQNHDRNVSLDLNIFADHIFRDHGSAVQMTYQLLPESVVYIVTSTGTLAALSYEEDQQIYAWSRFVLGGTSAVVESVASVPHGTEYYLYLVVKRTINGSTLRTIEYIRPDFTIASTTDWDGFVGMDNYKTGTLSGAVTTITGLSIFAGETVQCQVGTLFMSGTVNTSGVLTLSAAIQAAGTNGKTYRVGHGYTGWFKGFPLDIPGQAGTAQGKIKRISAIVLRLKDTTNFSHGPDSSNVRFEDFARSDDAAGAPPPHRTEDYRLTYDNGFDTRAAINIKQTQPYPLAVLAIMPEVTVY